MYESSPNTPPGRRQLRNIEGNLCLWSCRHPRMRNLPRPPIYLHQAASLSTGLTRSLCRPHAPCAVCTLEYITRTVQYGRANRYQVGLSASRLTPRSQLGSCPVTKHPRQFVVFLNLRPRGVQAAAQHRYIYKGIVRYSPSFARQLLFYPNTFLSFRFSS